MSTASGQENAELQMFAVKASAVIPAALPLIQPTDAIIRRFASVKCSLFSIISEKNKFIPVCNRKNGAFSACRS